MRNRPAVLELRSPQSLLRRSRRNAVRVEIAVSLSIVFSICTLVYAILQDPAILSTMRVSLLA